MASLASRCHHDCRCCNSLLAPASKKPQAYCYSEAQGQRTEYFKEAAETNTLYKSSFSESQLIQLMEHAFTATDRLFAKLMQLKQLNMAESLLSGFLLRPNPENAVAEVARVLRRLAALCWILLRTCLHIFAFSPDSSVDSITSGAN